MSVSGLKVLDCTIRDGGYVNNWKFDQKLVREVYRSLSKAGVDIVEIGYRGTEKYFDRSKYGRWRFSDENTVQEVTSGIRGARLAVMVDYGKVDLEDFCAAQDSVIDLVRIATHKNTLREAIYLLEKIKEKGYEVALNAMGFTNFTPVEQRNLKNMLAQSNIDYIYIVDSYGSLFPHQIREIFESFMEIPGIRVGFHPHNSLQMAFANTLEAIRCGVQIIDCTIYGMGRGAGNLPTESIIAYLQMSNENKYNVLPVLNCIHSYFLNIEKENRWGYQLPYMLSGMFQCHPSYAKTLVEMREYSVEDMWKVMEIIKKRNPVGFSKQDLEDIINSGLLAGAGIEHQQHSYICGFEEELEATGSNMPLVSDAPYIDRHKGKDFLVLANGPTLKEYKHLIDKFINKYDPIILGANYLGELFKPHYHAFNNKKRFCMYVDSVFPESKLLVGQHIPEGLIHEYISRGYESIYYLDKLDAPFDIVNGVIQTNCRTISVLLLGVAIVMGARRIFAVGMDGYIGNDANGSFLFYEEKDEKTDPELVIDRHRWCQDFIRQIDDYLISRGQEGVHILTPTSYKAFYKGIENYI